MPHVDVSQNREPPPPPPPKKKKKEEEVGVSFVRCKFLLCSSIGSLHDTSKNMGIARLVWHTRISEG